MKDLNRIDEKMKFEGAYHAIMKCAETFFRLAPNIPRNLCEVVQHIHGRYDMESDGRFRIVGKPKTDNTVLRSIVLYREGA